MSGKCITANVNLSSNEIYALAPMTYKKAGFCPGDHVSEGVGPGWWSKAGGEQMQLFYWLLGGHVKGCRKY